MKQLQSFQTKKELIDAFVDELNVEFKNVRGHEPDNDQKEIHRDMARGHVKYNPSLYKNGYIIYGFGVSKDREKILEESALRIAEAKKRLNAKYNVQIL